MLDQCIPTKYQQHIAANSHVLYFRKKSKEKKEEEEIWGKRNKPYFEHSVQN